MTNIFGFLIGLSFLLVACGKKPSQDNSALSVTTPAMTSEMERILERQVVSCEVGQICPSYVAKIVVRDGINLRYCTGFLTSSNVVATSSSCLPRLLRLPNQDCSQEVFVYFPKNSNRPAERVGCKRVLLASPVQGPDASIWRDDVSFLELRKSLVNRKNLMISRDGFSNLTSYTLWGVEQVDDREAIIRRRTCEAVTNSYVNPFVTSESSPMMTIAGCAFARGFTGAPLTDYKGELRGTISAGLAPYMRGVIEELGLLEQGKPLKEIMHATNYACAPTIYDASFKDEEECLKPLDESARERIREASVKPESLYAESLAKIKASLAKLSPYINFNFSINKEAKLLRLKVYPACFKKLSTWVPSLGGYKDAFSFSVRFPQRTFKPTMDTYGRVNGLETVGSDKSYAFEFYLQNIRSFGKSTLYMWDNNSTLSFPNFSETCSASLL